MRAYEVGALRREEARRRAGAMHAVSKARAEFLDAALSPDSPAAGKTVAELGLPRAAVLVSIRRGDETLIPRGDTRLRAGDVVTMLCEQAYVEEVSNLLSAPADSESSDHGE